MASPISQQADAARRFAEAHRALRADGTTQFDLRAAPPPPKPPAWLHTLGEWIAWALRPVFRFFGWLFGLLPNWPYASILLGLVLVTLAILLIWTVVERVRHGRWRVPFRRKRVAAETSEDEPAWAPEAAPARAWLREADELAAQGRYAEAVHHLLLRSVEDITKRRPKLIRPALTSRDIAAAEAIPVAARDMFAGIARIVERSLFGGRDVDEAGWSEARTAYADFALPGAWR